MLNIMIYNRAAFLKVAFLIFILTGLTANQTANAAPRQSCFSERLCFTTIEDNKSAKLLVRNDFAIPIRVSIKVKGQNITPIKALINISLLPGQTKEAFFIKSKSPKGWRYTWTSELHPGLEEVEHNKDVLYDLPFSPEFPYSIIQGPNGSFSHYDKNNNAIDWAMPVGTEILAAREGTVISYRENSSRGGSSDKYKTEQNYIWIRHSDGTVGQYLHLKEDGVLVEVGEQINRGQIIGLSGNTGYSIAPHLHFHVSGSQVNGNAFQTFPITFEQR